jgi:SAM-dependent methyltransferase
MYSKQRNEARNAFARKVAPYARKYQIGARGDKAGPDWRAIDLYDKSELIDHHWDLQNLPLPNEAVDCFVCNAVLEHVPNPGLAIYEMYRTLRAGGQIWVEVPFLQFYHAHPNDFMRWTLPGIRLAMQDFVDVRSGIATTFDYEAGKIFEFLHRDIGELPNASEKQDLVEFVQDKLAGVKDPRVYGSVFFWGEKSPAPMAPEKIQYFEYLKALL